MKDISLWLEIKEKSSKAHQIMWVHCDFLGRIGVPETYVLCFRP